MFIRNLHFALKSIRRNGVFSLINIVGLAVGICSALFIFIYVNFELSYDRFHQRHEDIYRVLGIDGSQGVSSSTVGITLPALGPAMEATMPEVEKVVRVSANHSGYVAFNGQNHYTGGLIYTEDVFFDVFSFKLLQSQSGALLNRPHAAVLTQSFAVKIFGDEAPLGKVLTFDGQDFDVVGIMEDVPADSHLQFDMAASLHYLGAGEEGLGELQRDLESWDSVDMVTYVRLNPQTSEAEVERKLTALLAERSEFEKFGGTLQPLADIHLGSGNILFDHNTNKGDAGKIAMLASVAVFILLIAGFNFMNLSTARASLRAREIGVRKAIGATRLQVVRQLLLESSLLLAIATVVALVLVELLQPVVSLALPDGGLGYLWRHHQLLLASSVGLVLLGLLAGAYPAFILSSLSHRSVLKGSFAGTQHGLLFRHVLVLTQFILSIVIIIGTAVAYQQLEFMKARNPGFAHEGIVNLELNEDVLQANYEALKNKLLQLPQVRSVAASTTMPGSTIPRGSLAPANLGNEKVAVNAFAVDAQYMNTLSMHLMAGRNFSEEFASDTTDAIILNESAVKALGWDDAIGEAVTLGSRSLTVIGVVQDFHVADMHHRIEPLMLLPLRDSPRVVSIALDSGASDAVIAEIASAWREVNPAYPFSYSYFSDTYNNLFRDDENFTSMASQFSFVAVVIACLGLYGLSSFSADQRKKEIGVRKVMGSSVWQIVLLLTGDFSRLVLASNLIAWPLAYFAMERWLEGFAYRIDLTPLIFIGSGAIALCVAWVTVASTVAKAASQKPVLALRYE